MVVPGNEHDGFGHSESGAGRSRTLRASGEGQPQVLMQRSTGSFGTSAGSQLPIRIACCDSSWAVALELY
eukprot:7381939-Prymnesium_polylepis.1